jgi:hypothetical protein
VRFHRLLGQFITVTNEPITFPWRHPKIWIPLLLLLVVISAFTAYRLASSSGVNRQLEALRAKGLPTSPAELDKWYSYVPHQENAALAFLDAYALYNSPLKTNNPSELNEYPMELGDPLPEPLAAAIEHLVTNNREAIQQAHKAAQLTRSRYPIDLTKGYETLLPHLAQMRQIAQLLKWEAVWQSSHGNKTEALQAVRSGFAVADSLRNEPLLISELVRIALLNETILALERTVSEQRLTDAELTAFIDLLERTEAQAKHSLLRGMIGERAGSITLFKTDYRTFDMLTSGGAGTGNGNLGEQLLTMSVFHIRGALGVADKDLAFYLDTMGKIEAAVEKEYPEMIRRTETITSEMQQEFAKSRFRYLVSGMTLPSLDKGSLRAAYSAGLLRCARTALAIERFRLQRDKIPTLNELVPDYLKEIPRDPVSGEPLEYERFSTGYRIVGVAATDKKTERGRKGKETEVAFTVLR